MITLLLLTKLLLNVVKASSECIECGALCVEETAWCDDRRDCPDNRDETYYCDVRLLVADSRILNVDPRVGGAGSTFIFNQSDSNPEFVRGVDYNVRTGQMYYTSDDGVYRANINGSILPVRIAEQSVYNPTGIAVDHITGNLYWVEERLSSIFVMSGKGERMTVVGAVHTTNPYDLVLDVTKGALYWTDWSTSSVKSSTLSGDNVITLYNSPTLLHPLGITLDQTNSILYLTDSESPGSIFQLNTDGTNFALTYKAKDDDLNGFLCLTYYNGMLYMTDTTYHSGVYRLYSLSVTEPLSTPTVVTEYRDMMLGVAALHYKLQPARANQCDKAGCQHLCLLSGPDSVKCACSDRYYLSADLKTCLPEEHYLLFTDQLNVVSLNIDDRRETTLDFGDIKMQVGVGVDMDQTTGTVYWSDIRAKMIVKGVPTSSNSTTYTTTVLSSDVQNPSGICVDWISKYVYWVDDGDNTLNVINGDGSMRKTVIKHLLDKPRSIKVDPVNGYLFWSDRGVVPNIARSNLDGSNRINVITTDLVWPNGIALDISSKQVYFGDASLDKIERCGYDGQDRVEIVALKASQHFSLAVLDDWIYYSDWQRKIIARTQKSNSSNEETLFTSFGVVMEIHVFSTSPLPGKSNDCSRDNGGCSHFCFYSPVNGVTCDCPDSITLNDDKRTCAKSPCDTANGGCEQVCTLDRAGTVQCSCVDFYELVGGVCQDSFLLLATKAALWKVSADGDSAYEKLNIPISGKVVAIDYDSASGSVYWTDTLSDAIYKGSLTGNTSAAIVETGLQTPDGIAYDWVTDTIYWTDMSTHSIGVTTSDGRFQKTIVKFNTDDKPRALVLDPVKGKMYFTDWGERSGVWSANLDGTNMTILVSDDVTWPNGLYLDRETQVLYWVDAKIDKLSSVNTDGTNRTVLTDLSSTHPFALTKHKDKILWTDWRHKSINVVNISDPAISQFYSTENQVFSKEQPFDIHWYSKSYQQGSNACAKNNGGCSHFCFQTPEGPVCACPDHINLQEDNKNCIEDPCQTDNGGCEDKCVVTAEGNTKCVCNDWKKLHPRNNQSCIPAEDYLLVLERQEMLNISVDTEPTFKTTLPFTKISNGASLDIDYRDGRVYWTDTLEDTISSAKLDGSDQKVLIRGLQLPDGLAFDWVAKNIYWTDTGTDLIQVASSEGKHLHNLSISDLDRPRALTLSPLDRVFFWSDWGTDPNIAKANMDGSGQTVLVNTALGWPNGLAFDWSTKILYWVDALQDMMESVSIDGTKRRVILDNQLQHPFGLTLYNNHLYWTDWTRQELLRATTNGSDLTVLLSRGSALMDLVMYAHEEQSPAPCYSEGSIIPEYDMLNGAMFIAVKGERAEISLTHSVDNRDETVQLILTTNSIHLVNTSSNTKINAIDTPSLLSEDYIRYFYLSLGVCLTKYPYSVLEGYTTGRRRGYKSLDRAKNACITFPDCSGITLETDEKKLFKFTLRSGSAPSPAMARETSWLLRPCKQGATKTLTIGKGRDITKNSIMSFTRDNENHFYSKAVAASIAGSSTWLCPGPIGDCGVDNGGCYGLCLVRPEGRSCACEEYSTVDKYGIKCGKTPHILIADRSRLLLTEMQGNEIEQKEIIGGSDLIVAVEYDLTNDKVYWSEPVEGTIQRADMDGTNPEVFLNLGSAMVEGLAIDWLHSLIYWVESHQEARSISVANLDGKHRVPLITDNLDKIRGLTIDPFNGWMYWCDWGEKPRVNAAWLDGTNMQAIETFDIHYPNSVTLDLEEQHLYYVDGATDVIGMIDVSRDNFGKKIKYFDISGAHGFAINIFGGHLYMSDWISSSIIQMNKYTGKGSVTYISGLEKSNDIQILHQSKRPKGKHVRLCEKFQATIVCPLDGVITRVKAMMGPSPDTSVCSATSVPSTLCNEDVSDQLTICLTENQCIVDMNNMKSGCALTNPLVMDLHYECSNGFTECDIDNGGCDHLCVVPGGAAKCICEPGYVLQDDSKTCQEEGWYVAAAIGARLIEFSSAGGPQGVFKVIPVTPSVSGLFSLISLYPATETLVWWDEVNRDIFSTPLRGDKVNMKLLGDVTVTALDIDITTGTIFYSENQGSSYVIKALHSMGRMTKVLVERQQPVTVIKVCPEKGYLFWVESGNLLMRSNMLGSPPNLIYTADKGITDFTVDHNEAFLYIGQSGTNRIKMVNFNGGTSAGEMTPKTGDVEHLAVFDNFLVVIDTSSVWKVGKIGDVADKLGDLVNSTDVAYYSNTTVDTPCSKLDCQFFCFILPDSQASCMCPQGYQMNATTKLCDGLCLENNGGCQHYCNAVVVEGDKSSVQCTCNVGYHLSADGKSCIESTSFLLAAREGGVYRYLLDQPEEVEHPPVLPGVFYFDYDWTNQHLIWYDEEKKSILKGNYSTPTVVHRDDDLVMHSLAFDWISSNIYWIDSGKSIKVVREDGGVSLTLIQRGLHRASDLQLHPHKGKMYFVTFGEAETFEIQSCNLDGSDREIVHTIEAQPGGLALDAKNDMLYYTLMGQQRIKKINLNTSPVVVTEVITNTNRPLNITAHNGHMIWVESNGVIWSTGESDDKVIALARGLGDVYLLRAYSADMFTGVNPCQEDNGGCSELCFAVPGPIHLATQKQLLKAQCACRSDVTLASDGVTCGMDPVLLVSATTEIHSVNIKTNETQITISNLSQAVIVDYDMMEHKIYWTDVKVDKIMRADLDGSNQEVIVDYGLVTPDGMAVDWINRNLYWSDSHTSRFEVARLDGSFRRSLNVERLSKPRGICIDPIHSQVFWADWGTTPFIARMDSDGTNLKVLAQRGLAWPNSLSINLETEQIMWVDASRDWIGIMDLDGSNMKIMSEGEVSHPFSIDHYMGVIYWSDWYKKSVIQWEYGGDEKESSVFLTTNGTLHHGIKVMHKTKQPTTPETTTPCMTDNGGCAQLCFAKPPLNEGGVKSSVCGCQSDMQLSKDGKSCEAPASRLIVARGHEMLHVIMNDGVTESINVLPVGNITAIIAFDFDIATGTIFFGDTYYEVLASVKLDGSDLKILVDSDISSPDGIAFDWISGNIYWTDTGHNKIEVCSRDGATRKVLVTEQIEEPRAIALDPMNGQMYWTDWGSNPKIEVADMTGGDRRTLISTDLGWPNGLVLDLENRVMYWTDAKLDWIGMADLDGSNVAKIITAQVHQPFSITIAGDYLMWSDWYLNSIHMARLSNHTDRSTMLDRYSNLMTLHYYDGDMQQKESNGCEEGHGCSHLCLYTPEGPQCACKSHVELELDGKTCKSDPCEENNGGCSDICSLDSSGVKCLCPEMSLFKEDGKTCIGSSQSLLIAAQNQIYRVTLDTPTPQVTPLTLRTNFCLALTYDRTTKRIIFRDGKWGILSALIDGTDLRQLNDDTDAFAMTVDSNAGNLYWVQKNMVKVSKTDGSHIKTLFEGKDSITDIIAYPQKHLLLWSSKLGDAGQIHSAGLDGSNRVVIDTTLVNPVSISIDFKTDLLYIVDESTRSNRVVYKMKLDGTGKEKIYTGDRYSFIDLAVEDSKLYWTQQPPSVLYSADLPNGLDEARLLLSHIPAFDLVLVNGTVPEGLTGCEDADCEGLCFAQPDGDYQCACEDDVPVSQTNSSNCGKDPELLVVKYDTISSYDLITGSTEIVIDGLQHASSVSYHHKKQLLVWADAVNDKIFSVEFNYPGNRSLINTVVGYGLESIVSVEVDWVTDKVYWIDSGTDTLAVVQLDGKYQSILPVNISEPSALALFPEEGLMFLADNELKKIFRMNMDGSEQSVLFETTDDMVYTSVKAMVVDQEHHQLYWADIGEDYAAVCNLDGSNARKLPAVKTSYATSMAVYEGVLYYSEMVLNQTVYGYDIEKEETSVLLVKTAQDILVKHISQQRPVKSQCSDNNGNCDHLCLLAGTAYTCACTNGMVQSPDNIYKCIEAETSIIVAGRSRLLKISLDTTPATISVLPLSLHTTSAIALAVDVLNEVYFWTDVSKDAIFRGYWNSSGWYQDIIIDTDVKTPDGMTFDWVSQILYWTDTAMTHIQVCKPDGGSRRTLVTGLSKPRALAVDPNNGRLYWSEWGDTPRIAQALTDGSLQSTLVSGEIGWPNGMAIDHKDRILYWADARVDKITSFNLNTKTRSVLASGQMHPFGMAVWGDYVYWSDWQHLAVQRVNRKTGGEVETVISGWKDLMGIALFHKQSQPVISESDCIFGNGDYFRGKVSTTISNRTCQNWNTQTPHQHSRTLENYPLSGVGDHNFCRNPDDEPFPWCYTDDSEVRWEYCTIKRCGVKRFESFSTPKSFFDAQAFCKHKGGELATVRDAVENTKLRFMLKIDERGAAWIGLINLHGNNSLPFTWTSSDATGYLNWADPDNYGIGYAVAMNVKDGRWVTYNESTTLPFACQIYTEPEGYTTAGTADGAMCSFPFYKDGALQYQCSPVEGDSGREKCGTVKTTKPLKVGNCLTRESGSLWETTIHNLTIPYSPECLLKVKSAGHNRPYTYTSETWHGDVSFENTYPNGTVEMVLLIGLHPERNSIAVQNSKYKQGRLLWGYQWVKTTYPELKYGKARQYFFAFNEDKFSVISGGETLLSIPLIELGESAKGVLKSISDVRWVIGGDEDQDEGRWVKMSYEVVCGEEDQQIASVASLDGRDVSAILSPASLSCEKGSELVITRELLYPIQQVTLLVNSGDILYMTVGTTKCDKVTSTSTAASKQYLITCDAPVMSDTLTITATSAEICSVSIHPLENLALNAPAILSNPHSDGSGQASLAVDGVLTGRSTETCTSSMSPASMRHKRQLTDTIAMWQLGPQFLRVDLGSERDVGQVVLYLHTNINPFEVHVGNANDTTWDANSACGTWQYSSSSDVVKRVNCGMKGRYVTVLTRDETKPITLCELEVFEGAEPTYGGNASGAPCMHPFTYNGEIYHDSCAVNETTGDPWCYTVPAEEDQTWGYCQHATEVNSCAFNNGGCSDLCFNTPEGSRCACSDFIKLKPDGKNCEVSKCTLNNGGCKETCKLDEEGEVVCGCKPWFKLNQDKVSCSPAQNFLLGANKTSIFNISLDTAQGSMEVLFDDEMANSIGIAYSQAKKRVFWTDATHDAIYSANFDGTDRQIIVKEGIFTPDCLAYDWTSDLIYWSDAGADKIEVVRSDGMYRNSIASGIEAPRGVALHSQKGLMFWTDWGQHPAIEMASMDGLNRKKIITSNIAWPNGITIDYTANRIIWVDAKIDVVESADLNGGNRRIIQDKDIVHPFGATLFGSEILWTDWGRRSVEAANKDDGTGRRTVYQGIRNPMNILAVQDQTAQSVCAILPCLEGICIPTSDSTRVCMCEKYVDLQHDRCERDPQLYLGMIDRLSHLNMMRPTADPIIVSNRMVSCIDFDQKDKKIYHGGYTDLWRSNFDGSDPEMVMNTGLADLTDIAVDWIGRNVYYMDGYLGILGVIRMDGKYRAPILSDLKQPHSVALAINQRQVFFTIWYHADHAKAGIWKVNMDGSGQPTQVHKSEVSGKYPWTLVVDHVGNKIWWSNSGDENNDFVCSSNLDGSHFKRQKQGVNLFVNFLSVHGDNVYYIDGDKHVIGGFNKDTGADISFRVNIESYEYELSSMALVHPTQQPWVYSRCHEDNGDCEQLCLPSPSGGTCMCGSGYSRFLHKTCGRTTEFVILATYSGLFELNLNPGSVPRRLPISLPYNTTSLHVDPVNEEVIWLESYLTRIVKGTLSGAETKVLIDRNIQDARGLHVDFVSGLIFWINGDNLEVANTKGENRKTLLRGVMSNVNDITADSTLGILYWVEATQPSVKRAVPSLSIKHALYSGEVQDDIVLESSAVPTYLTVNAAKDLLMWIDKESNTIQYLHLNETKPAVQTITSPYADLGTLIQLSMLHEWIYYRVQNYSSYEDESKLFRTSLLDFSKHAVVSEHLPLSQTMNSYDTKQSYWRGERKLIKSNDALVTRTEAADVCATENGTLAIINNADENDEVLAQLYGGKEMWIGASDPHETEDWVWPGGAQISYDNWRDRPFRINGSFTTIDKNGAWVSRGPPDNPGDRFGFICQVIYKSNKCTTDNGGCSHICLTSSNKAVCACPDYINLLPDGKTCEESPCLTAGCTDQCIVTKTGPLCICPAGMVMVDNVCEMTDSWVIIVTDSKIVRQSLNSDVTLAQTLAISHVRKTEAAAVDVVNDMIYFTDKHNNQIFGKKSHEKEYLLHTELRGQIMDLSYDWLDKMVVYSYYDIESNSHIVARSVSPSASTRVIKMESGYENKVMSVWCYPTLNYVFYTTWSGAVRRVTWDGSKTVDVYQGDGYSPLGVKADIATSTLYVSSNYTLYSMSLSGDNIQHVLDGLDGPMYIGDEVWPIPFAVHADRVYWSKQTSDGWIVVTKMINSPNVTYLYHAHLEYASADIYEEVLGIQLMNKDIQSGTRENNTIVDCSLPQYLDNEFCNETGKSTQEATSSIIALVVSLLLAVVLIMVIIFFIRRYKVRQVRYDRMEDPAFDIMTYDNPLYDPAEDDEASNLYTDVNMPVPTLGNQSIETYDIAFHDTPDDEDLLLTEHEVFDRI